MALRFVESRTAARTANILLYGPPGTGKTVGALSAPGPILLVNAEGPEGPLFAAGKYGDDKFREVPFEGRATLDEVYLHIRGDGHGFQTVVVDSLGEIYALLLAEYGGERPTKQQYGDVQIKIERFVRAMRDLPINLVLVAHEQIDDLDGEAVRRPGTGGRRLPEIVMRMMSIVAYTGVIPATEDQPARWMGQLIDGGGRRCKDRSGGLGQVRDVDLTEWIETAHAVWSNATTRTPTEAPA